MQFLKITRKFLIGLMGGYLAALILHLVVRLVLGDRVWPFNFFNLFTPLYFIPLALVVPLLAVLRAKRTARVGIGLLVVFLIWPIQWYWPRGEVKPTPGAPALRVLTFNALRSNHELGIDSYWLRDQNLDVLFLQEMSEYYGQYWVQWLDNKYPYWVQHGTNIIMSPHPLRPGPAGADDHYGVALLEVEGTTVALYVVHMPQPVDPARFGERNSFQRMAANYSPSYRDQYLNALLAELRAETRPFIVAGDFNTHDQNAIYPELTRTMHDSFRERATGPGWSWPVGENTSLNMPLPPFLRLDYIWHSDHFQTLVARQGPYLNSDHVPLFALLELNRPTLAASVPTNR